MEKCFNIKISGKVQDIGFRNLIEDIAKIYSLRGFTFNDIDNSVKMVCCGENGVLINIKGDTKVLPDIQNGIETLNSKFDAFNSKFGSYIIEQREYNQRMDEHNKHLEKILLKLADK